MRITDRILSRTLLISLNKNRTAMMKHQEAIATSKRISKPSDDPYGAARSVRLHSSLDAVEQYRRNIGGCLDWLSATESTLNEVESALTETRTLTLGALDDMAPQRETIALQVDQFLKSLVWLSGKKFREMFLFGGTETETPYTSSDEVTGETFDASFDTPVQIDHPRMCDGSVQVTEAGGGAVFVEDGDYTIDYERGTITVLGTGSMSDGTTYEISYRTESISSVEEGDAAGEREREIDEGVTMTINTPGSEVFTRDTPIFDTLIRLRDSLYRDDTAGIKGALDDLDTSLNEVLGVSAGVGSKIQRLRMADERLEKEHVYLSSTLSNTEDADLAEEIVGFQTEQNALQAAVQAGARIIQNTLIDYIG